MSFIHKIQKAKHYRSCEFRENKQVNRPALNSVMFPVSAQRFLAGSHGLSSKPITLEIRSHHVPDLTLIDLPGLIEVPMPNQPQDLPDKVSVIRSLSVGRTIYLFMIVIFEFNLLVAI